MNATDLKTLTDYHYWARDRLLEAVEPLTSEQYNKDLGNSFKSIRDTLVHLYAAEWAWHSRWRGVSPSALLSSDPYPDVPSLRTAWRENEARIRGYLDELGDDINRVIGYTLLSGASGSSPLWQMLQHVVNHASYHRGQVTTMLRQLGAKPPQSMDMIAFYRARG